MNLITTLENIELPSSTHFDNDTFNTYLLSLLPSDLNSSEKNTYIEFLTAFSSFWNYLYDAICHQEYLDFQNEKFDDQACDFSIGFDELIKPYSHSDQEFHDLNQVVSILRKQYSLAETQTIIRHHLRLFAKNENIAFSFNQYRQTDIYRFQSRLKLYYQNFLNQFAEEQKSGLRRSYIVSTNEIKMYLQNHFCEFNPYFTNSPTKKKL